MTARVLVRQGDAGVERTIAQACEQRRLLRGRALLEDAYMGRQTAKTLEAGAPLRIGKLDGDRGRGPRAPVEYYKCSHQTHVEPDSSEAKTCSGRSERPCVHAFGTRFRLLGCLVAVI